MVVVVMAVVVTVDVPVLVCVAVMMVLVPATVGVVASLTVRVIVVMHTPGEQVPEAMHSFCKVLRELGCKPIPVFGRPGKDAENLAIRRLLTSIRNKTSNIVLATHKRHLR